MLQVIHNKYRSERGAELVAACDAAVNYISVVFYDTALERQFARSVVFGEEITPENAAGELAKLFITAMREYGLKAREIKRVGFAAPVYTESALERGLTAEMLGLAEECPIEPVPFISAEISGRFTAMLLTVPDESFVAAELGRTFCGAVCEKGALRCFSVELCGAFDGSALSNGVPAEKGAIDLVRRQDDATVYEVIGDTESLGIAPCGAITAVNEMAKHGIVDENGIMTDRDMLFIGEDYFLSQNDVRAVQADKALTAAAFELLDGGARRAYFSGEPFSEAEGFRALLELGAIPERFRDASFARNSAEQGIISFLTDKSAERRAYEISQKAGGFPEMELLRIRENYLNYLNF